MLDRGLIHQGHVREIRDVSSAPRKTSAQPGDRYGMTSRCLENDQNNMTSRRYGTRNRMTSQA